MRNVNWLLGTTVMLSLLIAVPTAFAEDCPCPEVCEGDLNGDCVVDQQDLGILLANWGNVCDPFLRCSSWDCYDVKDNADILAKGGYRGVVSDGQYLYFVPDRAGSGPLGTPHGEVLRYGLAGDFFDPASWETFDYGDHCGDDCTDPDSYCGGAFDGERYVYFAPSQRSSGDHSEVMRYDTWASFGDAASWQTFDPGALGGYSGAVFAKGYVYFVPYKNSHSGEVLRYDTTGDFSSPASWETFNAKDAPLSAKGGYQGAVFDGQQYIYFVPYNGDDDWHGEVLRYDTDQEFTEASSWEKCDVVALLGAKGGYWGGVFDGEQYIYFVPFANGNGVMHGEVLRFDTLDPDGFCDAESWLFYDPGADRVGTDPDGYNRAVFDGQYVYFVPDQNEGGSANKHGEVLRYDTSCDFTDPSAWKTFDYGERCAGECDDPDGYAGAVFVAPYIYFAPWYNGTEYHGEVLRYDTTGGN